MLRCINEVVDAILTGKLFHCLFVIFAGPEISATIILFGFQLQEINCCLRVKYIHAF